MPPRGRASRTRRAPTPRCSRGTSTRRTTSSSPWPTRRCAARSGGASTRSSTPSRSRPARGAWNSRKPSRASRASCSEEVPVDATVRPLTAADFEAVVALDARISGAARRGYFEKRLQAALRRPHQHLQLATEANGTLTGFVLSRKAGGEYGDPEGSVVLEAFGVDPVARHKGVATRMLARLVELARERNISALVTQANWRDHGILRFLDAAGFELAPRRILEAPVERLPVDDRDVAPPLVRNLREGDLEALARIDERITGRDRADYLRRKLDEVLHESAIQVSLVVEDDGFPVGFAMARVDFG